MAAIHPVMLEALTPTLRHVSMADCLAVVAAVKPEPAYKPFAISGRYIPFPQWGPQALYCVYDRMTNAPIRPLMALSLEDAKAEARVLNAAWRDDA